MTTTEAKLPVSKATYDEIRSKLLAAGYVNPAWKDFVSMNGVRLVVEEPKPKKRRRTQIKFPLHVAQDAQGAMGIFDKSGHAVAMFTDTFVPTKGYCWHPGRHRKDPTVSHGTTCYYERNQLVLAVLDAINKIYEV